MPSSYLRMEYMIRFTQTHETFRLAEIKALAVYEGIDLEILSYSPSVSSLFIIFVAIAYIHISHRIALSN